METSPRRLVVLLAFGALAPAATAQTQLWKWTGVPSGVTTPNYGLASEIAGDVDGDGYDDVIVGAMQEDAPAIDAGAAWVYSGRTGGVLFHLAGDGDSNYFGRSVAGVGDTDLDGFPDLLVGASGVGGRFARLYSGHTGTALVTYSTPGSLGEEVRRAGDVNLDGFADFLAADPDEGDVGAVHVYSGKTRKPIRVLKGAGVGEHFGVAALGGRDLNGDGVPDYVVGANYESTVAADAGAVRAFSGKTGKLIFQILGNATDDEFGVAVDWIDDVNGDGVADLVVGAPFDDASGIDAGSVQIRSGKDGTLVRAFLGEIASDKLGFALAAAGDVDGDGTPDLVAGSRQSAGTGAVWIWRATDGTELKKIVGAAAGDSFGASVAGNGDLNFDGFADVVACAVGDDAAGPNLGSATALALSVGTPGAPATLAVVLKSGKLVDSLLPAKDTFKAIAVVAANALSAPGAFDPAADGVTLSLGSDAAPFVLQIPAGDPHWKVGTTKLAWKSAPGVAPVAAITVDLVKGTLAVSLSKFEWSAPPANPIRVAIALGPNGGTWTGPWLSKKAAQFQYPK